MPGARLKIFSHFKFSELSRLGAGKLLSVFRDDRFDKLQDREIKLALIYAHDPSPVFEEETVIMNYPFSADKKIKLELRIGGSDVFVFQQVLVQQSYRDVISLYQHHFGAMPIRIVDAGANIGTASIYFSLHCPGSEILAIEPDDRNVRAAQKNLSLNEIKSVNLRRAALWAVPRQLSVMNDFRDGSDWSLRVEENSLGNVDSITPTEVVDFFNGSVDLFKIDIEGGEARLFEDRDCLGWLHSVKAIAIEIHHERIDPSLIIESLLSFGFQVHVSGELTIGINSSFLNKLPS
jgi:FkbM family methyltransferase